MKKIFLLLAAACVTLSAAADEGMWMLPYLQKMNSKDMKARGCKLSAEEIYSMNNSSLKDAIVIFGGGCTGEIVSPDGLLFTNHHCGYGSIQSLSSVEHDYLKNGFWAMSRADVGCAGDILCIDGKAMRGTVLENGRNPDIVSAYSLEGGVTLATDMCEEKSNEITSVPKLLDKVDVSGCIVTADAMSFQKAIIDKIREKGGDFLIELKANQRTLRYGVEDNVELAEPVDVYSEGPFLEHGRIETRVCRIFRGNDLITDREKWNGNLTVVEIRTATERKSDGQKSSERRFYVSSFHGSARRLGTIARMHWAIESMHWDLDRNLRQDFIRRNSARSARNLDTIQRMVLAILSIWKGKRKKPSEKAKGTAELIGELSLDFTAMMHMLDQK